MAKEKKVILRGHVLQLPGQSCPVIRVHCPFCDTMHTHGATKEIREGKAEHRVAHCRPDSNSPFFKGGYWVAPFRKKDSKSFRHAVEG